MGQLLLHHIHRGSNEAKVKPLYIYIYIYIDIPNFQHTVVLIDPFTFALLFPSCNVRVSRNRISMVIVLEGVGTARQVWGWGPGGEVAS